MHDILLCGVQFPYDGEIVGYRIANISESLFLRVTLGCAARQSRHPNGKTLIALLQQHFEGRHRQSLHGVRISVTSNTRDVDVEAVLLTGGASRRMGEDKAKLLIDGMPLAERVASSLTNAGLRVTVLGREPLKGCGFIRDDEEFGGPLAALTRFKPAEEFVFVCSCDLPLFDARLASLLREKIGGAHAAVPVVNGFRQPLAALYRGSAFDRIADVLPQEGSCPMMWLRGLEPVEVSEAEIAAAGIDPQCAQGANTKEELRQMLASRD